MPEVTGTMHDRYDADEQRLIAAASNDLWTSALVDDVVDVASPILQAASWRGGAPDDAPERWSQRSTAVLALGALSLRAARVTALTVRAGYAAEAFADLRRLNEAAGHARNVALDASGHYAENWLEGRGKPDKPRVAFAAGMHGDLWEFMSGQSHAVFEYYARLSANFDDARVLNHQIAPRRFPPWDNMALWFASRQFTTVLACVLKVHSHIDQTDFLATATRIVQAEEHLEAEVAEASAA